MTDLLDDQNPEGKTPRYFDELVGEGRKFKTPEDLAKGKYEADVTIDLMKKRMDELRTDYLKLREENEKQDKLKSLIDNVQQQRLANSDNTQAKEDAKTLKPEEIETLIDRKYQERRTLERQTENLNSVQAKLKETWGDNFSTILKQKTEELDLTSEEVNSMAKNNPKLFFRTIGVDAPVKGDVFQAPPRSEQRTDNFSPSSSKKRTWSYYQELKKANPQLYFDRATAVQMAKDAVEYGEAFQDGNYYVKGLHER